MNDRELLEMAAKAAGYETGYINDKLVAMIPGSCGTYGCTRAHSTSWNPLTDDADAFRLAAKLEMEVKFSGGFTYGVGAVGTIAATDDMPPMFQIHQGDPHDAARRAIVRAAAEIGKNMP